MCVCVCAANLLLICCYCIANGLVLRQALSISGALGNVRAQTMPVVIELMDIDSFNIVNLVNLNSEIVVTHDIVGQIMVSCSRQPGLAFLLEKLSSFENSEFYFKAWPQLYGQRFSDLVCAFDDAIVLGIKREDGNFF
jgi:ion channel POLLUX/CASTOR